MVRARQLLGVQPDATAEEIEAEFRRRAWAMHPDRGGSAHAFIELTEAREQLTHRGISVGSELPQRAGGTAGPGGVRGWPGGEAQTTRVTPTPVTVVPDASLLRQLLDVAGKRWTRRHGGGRQLL